MEIKAVCDRDRRVRRDRMKGEGDIVTGFKNRIQAAVANVTPAETLAKQHRKMAEPGSAKH